MELIVGILSIVLGFSLLEITHTKNGYLARWQVWLSVAIGTACSAMGILVVVINILDWVQGN